jgi:hypothetical protein
MLLQLQNFGGLPYCYQAYQLKETKKYDDVGIMASEIILIYTNTWAYRQHGDTSQLMFPNNGK